MVVNPTTILQQAQIEVQAGKVLAVHESPTNAADVVLTGKTLLPGFVNAHTHLEFSDLESPIPASNSFAEWIASVIRHRRNQAQSLTAEQLGQARSAAIRRGLMEVWTGGTAVVVDIATQPLDLLILEQLKELDERFGFHSTQRPKQADFEQSLASICALPELFCLPEVIGLDKDRFQQTLQWAQLLPTNFIDQQSAARADNHAAHEGSLLRAFGISPHSPYSLLHPQAIDELTKMDEGTLVAMHVAESLDELEWLKFGTGSFREVYSRVGLPVAQDRMQVEQAVELLSRFHRALLVHGNYLTPKQLDQVARSTTAIVYCPRTHRHFNHQGYPLGEILRRDIPLLLGTDSRASNPDLDIWQECRQAARAHPDWSAVDIFAAATTRAAEYLDISDCVGSLKPGKRFIAKCLDTPTNAKAANLLESLLRT